MMMPARALLPASVLILAILACGTSSPAAPETPTSLFPVGSSPAPAPASETGTSPLDLTQPASTQPAWTPSGQPEFTVAVIVDTTTEQVTREHAQALVNEARGYLHEFSPIGLTMIDFVEEGGGGSMAEIANRYVAAHTGALPGGLVIFSFGEGSRAKSEGGYGFSLPGPAGFRNLFVSPSVGAGQIYVAVVDSSYKYMPCGYGGSSQVSSAAALPGECRGQTGIACVANNGYSMCSNAVGNLYTSTPTHAVASMIVHGLLHNFGPSGDQDDYDTPLCKQRMGYPTAYFDLQESEYYNGLCPFVYEEFTKAYRP